MPTFDTLEMLVMLRAVTSVRSSRTGRHQRIDQLEHVIATTKDHRQLIPQPHHARAVDDAVDAGPIRLGTRQHCTIVQYQPI